MGNLEAITTDDIKLLELIRGVNNFKLRQEFLGTKEPKLDDLLRIARNWHTADEVEKNMGSSTSTVNAGKTSSYKKGKNSQWEEKAKSKEDKAQTKDDNPCYYCGH